MVGDHESDMPSPWNMNDETCKAIRYILNQCNIYSMEHKFKEWYDCTDRLEMEAIPIIKVKTLKTRRVMEKKDKLVERFNEYTDVIKKNKKAKLDISELKKALKEFEISIRYSLADDGILMAKPDDPRFAFGGKN